MKICKFESCERSMVSRGWCSKHYARWRTHGDPAIVLQGGKKPGPVRYCDLDDCDGRAYSLGWCSKHFQRWKKTGDPNKVLVRLPHQDCLAQECSKKNYSLGWCVAHYRNWQRNAGVTPKSIPGRTVQLGYVQETSRHDHPLSDKRGRVMQHRRIMFDLFGFGPHKCFYCDVELPFLTGRDAIKGIQVDHLDTDRRNNDPINLVFACGSDNNRQHHVGDHTATALEMTA